MENKIYIIEMCDNGEYRAFSTEAKAKEFMMKQYLKNNINEAKHCVMNGDKVDKVVNIIRIDLEYILNQGYLEDAMYMHVAELDKEADDE